MRERRSTVRILTCIKLFERLVRPRYVSLIRCASILSWRNNRKLRRGIPQCMMVARGRPSLEREFIHLLNAGKYLSPDRYRHRLDDLDCALGGSREFYAGTVDMTDV